MQNIYFHILRNGKSVFPNSCSVSILIYNFIIEYNQTSYNIFFLLPLVKYVLTVHPLNPETLYTYTYLLQLISGSPTYFHPHCLG